MQLMRLQNFDGSINFNSHQFDYRKPDISFLNGARGHIIVFSRHSVEQVDVIAHQLYQMMIDLNVDISLMHFEPVGWQRRADLCDAREREDASFFEAIGESFAENVESEEDQTNNAAWWSWRLKYNKNLLSIAHQYSAFDGVKIVRKAYDFDGIGNVLNPTSLIHLEMEGK